MTTLNDLPVSDPIIARVLNHLWIGNVKISPDTVLDPLMIHSEIKRLENADVCNSWEAASVSQAIGNLKKILSYIK